MAEKHFDSVERERGIDYNPFRRWQYFVQRTMGETYELKSSESYDNELEINTADNKIYAATYGRGFWKSNVNDETLNVNDVSSFNTGVYFVKLNSTKGEITKKLILK